MIEGRVTTIIPVFNRPGLVLEAIDSVLNQDYDNIEIIVINDGSTDDTADVIDSHYGHLSKVIKLISNNRSMGPGLSRQRGLDVAQGEFVQYLDSDDLLLPDKFKKQIPCFENPRVHVTYGWTQYQHKDGNIAPQPWKGSGSQRLTMFPEFARERWWDTPCPIYRKSVCDKIGPWLDLWQHEDWEYDCRVAALGGELAYVSHYVCVVRDHFQDRLSNHSLTPKIKLANRAKALEKILAHSIQGGVLIQSEQFQDLIRLLFLVSRQCGYENLTMQSEVLFDLSRHWNSKAGSSDRQFWLYRLAANLLGWKNAARLARVHEWFLR